MQQYFSVEGSSYFSLTNINGAVGINSWQQNIIKVRAIIIAETQESRGKVIVERQQQGEKISVYTDYKARAYRHNNTDAVKVDYQVWLSAETNLSDIALVNGSLTIENIHEDLAAEIVNGTVKAMALRGIVKLARLMVVLMLIMMCKIAISIILHLKRSMTALGFIFPKT